MHLDFNFGTNLLNYLMISFLFLSLFFHFFLYYYFEIWNIKIQIWWKLYILLDFRAWRPNVPVMISGTGATANITYADKKNKWIMNLYDYSLQMSILIIYHNNWNKTNWLHTYVAMCVYKNENTTQGDWRYFLPRDDNVTLDSIFITNTIYSLYLFIILIPLN